MDNNQLQNDHEPLTLNVGNLMRQMAFRIKEHDVAALGAQMTYYIILSVFPFFMLLLSILANTNLSSEEVLANIVQFMPDDGGSMILEVINETVNASSVGLMSVSMVAALWSSSNGIAALMKGVNKAYDLEEKRPFWRLKGIAVLFTIGLIGMIIIVLVMLVLGEVIGQKLFGYFAAGQVFVILWNVLRYLIPLGGLIGVFILFFRFAPTKSIKFRQVVAGAVFTTLGWIGISQLFSTYVNQFGNYARVYGSIGGIIVFLIWLNLSAVIILAGGELNAAVAYLRSDERTVQYEQVPYLFHFLHKNEEK